MEDSQIVDNFHDHLKVCKQCRENPMGLCSIGAPLLRAAGEKSAPIEPTKYCMSCGSYKPVSQMRTLKLTNVDKRVSHITRCNSCWARRGK